MTAREGKPILIIEEGDAETAAWAQHSLEVDDDDDDDDADADADDDEDDDDDYPYGRSNKVIVLECEASFIGWT